MIHLCILPHPINSVIVISLKYLVFFFRIGVYFVQATIRVASVYSFKLLVINTSLVMKEKHYILLPIWIHQ